MSVTQPLAGRQGEAIDKLAAFLTDNGRVVRHSIGLQASNPEATAFYDLRAAFSVSGYATADEAQACILHTLGLTR